MSTAEKVKIVRWQNGRAETREDLAAGESLLRVRINDERELSFAITPEELREFVYGNLLAEGWIKSLDEVKDYREMKRKDLAEVGVRLEGPGLKRNAGFLWNYNVLAGDCANVPVPPALEEGLDRIRHGFRLGASQMARIQENVKELAGLYRDTGAFHYAILFTPELEPDISCHDISRHNAMDKAIGKAVLSGTRLEERVLFTTGRINSNAVLKCMRARIPFILSRGACFLNAARLAREYDLGVVGFLRSTRFNVYSGEEHIDFED